MNWIFTTCPVMFLYRTHFPSFGLQYSITNVSVYSWPCPLPNLPWVSTAVMTLTSCKLTSSHSFMSLVTGSFGHQAPPSFSVRTLKRNIKFYILRSLKHDLDLCTKNRGWKCQKDFCRIGKKSTADIIIHFIVLWQLSNKK